MSARGVVAAGHPLTAEAGASVLREGGNAVDAAVAAVMTSCVTESPLTGLGAGGYMLVHNDSETVLLDFFVAAPGLSGGERGSELVPIPIHFTEHSSQMFHVGAASCGVLGTPAGLVEAVRRFGSVSLAELAMPAARLARDGVELNLEQAYFIEILAPILTHYEEAAAIYAPGGSLLRAGDLFRFPELGDALELLGTEGAQPFYQGEIAQRVSEWVLERGGTLAAADLAAYEPIARAPVRAGFRGREVLTNPPPSSGGLLIAFALELLARSGDANPGDRGDRRRDADSAVGAHARVSRRPVRGRLRRPVPLRRPPRLDDSHHGGRRRRLVCERHLLERDGLRTDRPRDRDPRQQHAR